MQKNRTISLDLLTSESNPQQSFQSAAIINNRLEALKVLSNSLLYELEAMKMNEESVKNGKINLAGEVQRFEADLIRTALLRTGGRQRPAARLLSIKANTLNAKIKRLGIEPNNLIKNAD
jgi:DNA-binding NtrC family response regulator